MVKPNVVSDEAKISLYMQQGTLIDVIDSMLTKSGWLDYFYSTVSEFNPYQTQPQDYENAALDLMKVFRDSIFLGVTPPAVILIYLAQFFDRYLKDSGTLSLDEAFKLKGRNKIGHPLKIRQQEQHEAAIFFGITILRKLKSLSIEAAAGEIIDSWGIEAHETVLKKKYIKFRKNSEKSGNSLEWSGELTPELIEYLELMLAHAFTIYTSGIPKAEMSIDREIGKQHLKEHLVSCIEKLGITLE